MSAPRPAAANLALNPDPKYRMAILARIQIFAIATHIKEIINDMYKINIDEINIIAVIGMQTELNYTENVYVYEYSLHSVALS